jgi:hypothetical protein
MYVIQHCFICRPSDLTVSDDAGIKPRPIATLPLPSRRSTTRLDLIGTSYPPRLRHCDPRELIVTPRSIVRSPRSKVQDLKPCGSATLDQTRKIRHSYTPRLGMRWGPHVKYSEI